MKSSKLRQENNRTILDPKSGVAQINRPARDIIQIFINFLRRRQELAVVVSLGTCVILSLLFLHESVRAMIPVKGIFNWNDVRIGNDFIVFYSSGALAMGGEAASAYDLDALNTFQHDVLGVVPENLSWRYPPIYFFFLVPFANLGYISAFWAWSVLMIMVLMIVVRKISFVWYFPLLAPLCLPVAYTMAAGQNGILSAIIIGSGLAILPRSEVVAGLIFGLLAYKPHLAVALPFCLLAGRYYSAFICMAVTAVVLGLLSWYFFGSESWLEFLHGLLSQTNSIFGARHINWERVPTVMITALQLLDSYRAAWLLQACASFLAIAIATWVWRTSTKPAALALSLVAAMPLVSPYVWDYDMAILVIPMVFLANDAEANKWTAGRFILITIIWISEPSLRLISGSIGLQLGPFVWAILLGYSVFLVKDEPYGAVKSGLPAT
jgi:hypothetical protein